MFDTFLGLPVHILVIHAVVVLGPLAALAAIAYAVAPPWRRVLRWPLTALAAHPVSRPVPDRGAARPRQRSGSS